MLLKAVCGSTVIEGMEKAAQECREELFKLSGKASAKIPSYLKISGSKRLTNKKISV